MSHDALLIAGINAPFAPFAVGLARALRERGWQVRIDAPAHPLAARLLWHNGEARPGRAGASGAGRPLGRDELDDALRFARAAAAVQPAYTRSSLRRMRARLAGLSAYVDAVLARGVTRALVLNGQAPVQRVAVLCARRRGVPLGFVENGLFPDTLQWDPEGVNAAGSAARLGAADYRAMAVPDGAAEEIAGRFARGERRTDGARIELDPLPEREVEVLSRLDRPVSARRLASFLGRRLRRRSELPPRSPRTDAPFVLWPLQVPEDTQMALHSPLVRTFAAALPRVREAVDRAFGPRTPLVLRPHPLDPDPAPTHAAAARLPHTLWAPDGDLRDALQRARVVLVVNSTVGFEALLLRRPVVALGAAVWAVDGVAPRARTWNELPDRLVEASNGETDEAAWRGLIHHLHEQVHVPGTRSILFPDTLIRLESWRRGVQLRSPAPSAATARI